MSPSQSAMDRERPRSKFDASTILSGRPGSIAIVRVIVSQSQRVAHPPHISTTQAAAGRYLPRRNADRASHDPVFPDASHRFTEVFQITRSTFHRHTPLSLQMDIDRRIAHRISRRYLERVCLGAWDAGAGLEGGQEWSPVLCSVPTTVCGRRTLKRRFLQDCAL